MFRLVNIQDALQFLGDYLNVSKFVILTILTASFKRSDFPRAFTESRVQTIRQCTGSSKVFLSQIGWGKMQVLSILFKMIHTRHKNTN